MIRTEIFMVSYSFRLPHITRFPLSPLLPLSLLCFIVILGCLSLSISPIILSICFIPLAQHLPLPGLSSRSFSQAKVASQWFSFWCLFSLMRFPFFIIPSHLFWYQVTHLMVDFLLPCKSNFVKSFSFSPSPFSLFFQLLLLFEAFSASLGEWQIPQSYWFGCIPVRGVCLISLLLQSWLWAGNVAESVQVT